MTVRIHAKHDGRRSQGHFISGCISGRMSQQVVIAGGGDEIRPPARSAGAERACARFRRRGPRRWNQYSGLTAARLALPKAAWWPPARAMAVTCGASWAETYRLPSVVTVAPLADISLDVSTDVERAACSGGARWPASSWLSRHRDVRLR